MGTISNSESGGCGSSNFYSGFLFPQIIRQSKSEFNSWLMMNCLKRTSSIHDRNSVNEEKNGDKRDLHCRNKY